MRPVRRRTAARVIVLAQSRVLLQLDTDPGIPGSRWWVTPGGGLEPGETPAENAARELREETGLTVTPAMLGEPVMSRRVVHGYSDRILIQDEIFFRIEVEPFEPAPTELSESERQRLVGLAWHPVTDLPEPLWPADLARVLTAEAPLGEVGLVEESTVPVVDEVDLDLA